jgi:hypothetical protein
MSSGGAGDSGAGEASAHHICNPVEGAAVMDVVEAQVIEAEAIFVVAKARLA